MAALLVGVTGSAMSLGFEQGLLISDEAGRQGTDPLFTMMPVMLVLLSGTFVTTIIWCLFLGKKNRSLKDYINISLDKVLVWNYLFGLLAGLLWFSPVYCLWYGKK